MTSAVPATRPWLPEGALTSPQAAAAVAGVVGDWARHWFHAPGFRAAARWTSAPDEGAGWAPPRPLSPYVAVQGRTDGADLIGQALVALPSARTLQPAHDRQLLGAAGRSVLADLDDRLAGFVGDLGHITMSHGSRLAAPRLCLAIEDAAGHAVHRLLAEPGVVIALARLGVEKRKAAAVLTPRSEALADARVACGILLGRAHLPYADVRGLAVGDVVILAAGRAAARDLLVEGKVAAHAAVHIPAAGNISLPQQGQAG